MQPIFYASVIGSAIIALAATVATAYFYRYLNLEGWFLTFAVVGTAIWYSFAFYHTSRIITRLLNHK